MLEQEEHQQSDSKPSNVEPEVDIVGFNMFYLDALAEEVRGSEWIKIEVDR